MRYGLILAIPLFGIWLVWSGHYTPLLISLGAASVALVLLVVDRMGHLDREAVPLHLLVGAMLYVPWLAWEIVKANLHVARVILSPRLPIAPRVIRVAAGQRSDLARVIHANSITLTPGTVSIRLEGSSITVHALTRAAADGVLDGAIDRRVRRLEGRRG